MAQVLDQPGLLARLKGSGPQRQGEVKTVIW
jgi:hypothetical protein